MAKKKKKKGKGFNQCTGNLEVLDELIEDGDFYVHALDRLEENSKLKDKEYFQEEEVEVFLERNLDFILEKLFEHRNLDFMFEENFYPVPRKFTEKELRNMTEAELDKFDEHFFNALTQQELHEYLLKSVFLQEILIDEENGVEIPKNDKGSGEYFNKIFARVNEDMISNGDGGLRERKNDIRPLFEEVLGDYWEFEDKD